MVNVLGYKTLSGNETLYSQPHTSVTNLKKKSVLIERLIGE